MEKCIFSQANKQRQEYTGSIFGAEPKAYDNRMS